MGGAGRETECGAWDPSRGLSTVLPPSFPWTPGVRTLASRHSFAVCPWKAIMWTATSHFYFCERPFNELCPTPTPCKDKQ